MDQVEYFDSQMTHLRTTVQNRSGFLVTMIRENWPVPCGFQTTRKREIRRRLEAERTTDVAAVTEARRELRRMEWEEKYKSYVEEWVQSEIQKRFTAEELERQVGHPHLGVGAYGPDTEDGNLVGPVLGCMNRRLQSADDSSFLTKLRSR